MDYKKKYENALEWARQVINGECGFIRKDVEEVFPELKKSEDEKIRKAIVELVLQSSEILGSNNQSRMLAWLEKQEVTKKSDAWSEEDDYNVQCCIAKAVADMQTGNIGRNNELIDWLKALKQRLAL